MKVEIDNASPSAELVKQALREEVIDVGDGRKLTVRKPGVLAQFRLVQAVGPEVASNQTYMQMINPLLYLGKIDDEVVMPPMNLREVEALIQGLGDAGLGAIMAWYIANVIGPTMEAIQAEEQRDRLKNS